MKHNENRYGTIKNRPGAIKTHENQTGTIKKHGKPTRNHE